MISANWPALKVGHTGCSCSLHSMTCCRGWMWQYSEQQVSRAASVGSILVSANPTSQLHVFLHDSDTLGMDSAQLSILHNPNLQNSNQHACISEGTVGLKLQC